MSSSAICVWYEQHTHTYHTQIHIQMYLHYKCVPPCFSFKGSFCLNKMHIHMYLCMNVYEFMYEYKTLNKLLKLQVIQQNHIWSFQNLRRGYIFIILQIRKMPEVKLQIFLRSWNDRLHRSLVVRSNDKYEHGTRQEALKKTTGSQMNNLCYFQQTSHKCFG